MMGKGTSFILLQASVVFNQQMSLFGEEYEDTKEGRNKVFRNTIQKLVGKKTVKISSKNSEYVLVYSANISDDIIYFQLAKRTSVKINALVEDSFKQETVPDYPPLNVFVNLRCQQFAVELNTKILNITSIVTTIKNFINTSKNFSIFVNTIEDRKEFWNIFSDEDSIQEVSFDMVVPNFFGVSGDAGDLVSEAKSQLNADSVELSFKNKKGGLKANIAAFDSFVRYSATSGSWKIKLKSEGESRYRTIKSTDFCIKKEIESSIIDLIKNIDGNGQVGPELVQGLVEHINNLFDTENLSVAYEE